MAQVALNGAEGTAVAEAVAEALETCEIGVIECASVVEAEHSMETTSVRLRMAGQWYRLQVWREIQ
jgi:hypothetical protein